MQHVDETNRTRLHRIARAIFDQRRREAPHVDFATFYGEAVEVAAHAGISLKSREFEPNLSHAARAAWRILTELPVEEANQ